MGNQSTYTEHVTRVLAEDRAHEGIGTVAVLTFAPQEGSSRPATLGPQSLEAIARALETAISRAEAGEIQALALTGTDRVFLAGADLAMFADDTASRAVSAMTDRAHALQVAMRAIPVPVLAHLNGATLGGGLEVALMADIRTAAPGVRGIGVPETSLGILPGWGGTTLLTSVVGPENGVRMILEDPARDTQLSASAAQELGLVDALAGDLDAALDVLAARMAAGDLEPSARPDPIPAADSEEARALRAALDAPHSPAESRREWAQRMREAGAPALSRAVGLLDALPGRTLPEALAAEAEGLLELVASDGAAGSLYAAELLRRGKPGRTPVEGARAIRKVGVAGAGLMASQIAAQLALGLQVPVVLRDLDEQIAQKGLAHAREVIAQAAAKGALTEDAAQQVAGLLSATVDVADLADCDLVLEAVPEVLAIKKSVFAELEGVLAEDALLVTNTSSLSVAAMSADLAHPERVVGLHFFNPVAKMPLVEVINAPATNEVTLATGREVVRRCRKFAVESADAPGFIVNRLLFRVLCEVLASVDAGADPAEVDASIDEMGLPMRPFALLDLVGTGVADHVGRVLAEELGTTRFPISKGLAAMVEQKKSFTVRAKDQVHPAVSDEVAPVFAAANEGAEETGAGAPVGPDLLAAVQRGLAEEVGLMLSEGVVERPEQIDLAMILGAGYPRHRGGLTPYLDQCGAAQDATGSRFHGERFAH
ncbi:3-hydroxyacyl-CoA dehydrogenase NAD-binding domain-containing protein [Brachybacterium sp. JHP9]|uniref:enoyl-CoA hydratase n=1 Tax=Brachybacterium equifaecis TaxID=2910770 RepID=A0ABT0R3D7_9MICO|nr:3-hydroxyacyl-CoA dehydrogenase NAD-binding domain-containing protein [Brachybacterium equifaecis]MCL6424437.1 3-hydroxyacyl-CoA dehydrogenase NAD-binding domain-containing protein [Brachybacterium equifaecis]